MIVFEKSSNQVAVLTSKTAPVLFQPLSLQGAPNFNQHRSIITKATLDQNVNIQFIHSLGKYIYVYVFGDRMGESVIMGLSWSNTCESDAGDNHGVGKIYEWYKAHKASSKDSKAPVRLLIGAKDTIIGFITGMSTETLDPSTGICQWSIRLAVIPEDD